MISIRSLSARDTAFLEEMLYLAIFIPPCQPPLDREILKLPEIRRYVENWGRVGDSGLMALDGEKPAGAVWLRLWQGEEKGYGYVSENIPELTIAMLPEYRGQGIGTLLLKRVIEAALGSFPAISLSVEIQNPALHLYERIGFIDVSEEEGSQTMIFYLPPTKPAPLPNVGPPPRETN
jgi:GNAT superfamily N-acetyltransferase